MTMDDSINIYRSQIVANTFHLFIAGAKASLYPFLTLFFRYVGLSATQTGIVIGVKTFLSMLSTPIWMTCASRCHRKRCILMTSIFIAMLSSLLLSLVPPPENQNVEDFCLPKTVHQHKNTENDTYASSTTPEATTSIFDGGMDYNHSTLATGATSQETGSASSPNTQKPTTSTTVSTTTSTKMENAEEEILSELLKSVTEEDLKELGLSRENLTVHNLKELIQQKINEMTSQAAVTTEANSNSAIKLSEEDKKLLIDLGLSEDEISNMDYDTFLNYLIKHLDDVSNSRKKRNALTSSMDSLNTEISKLQDKLTKQKNAPFIIVLSIVIMTGLFSSSIERMADKIWFDFADGIDMVEKYNSYRTWQILGWVFVPVLVTVFVDYSECVLPFGMYHFTIHFYVFAALMGFGFIWSFMLPMFREKKKVQRHTSLWRGLKVLCVDARAFSFCVCVLILGLASAVIDNFLIWQIQDLGGTEMVLGGAITMGAFVSLIIHIILRWIVYKIGYAGAVIVSLFALAIRMVVYAYMWAPWAVLAVGFLSAFSHTLLLGTIENYPDFKVNPYIMDRSAKSVISSLYIGVAYTAGSVASGFLYDSVGLHVSYQGLAILTVIWGLIFALIQKCSKPGKKLRYARLLQAEEDQISDDYDSDDDWLQTALKHEK